MPRDRPRRVHFEDELPSPPPRPSRSSRPRRYDSHHYSPYPWPSTRQLPSFLEPILPHPILAGTQCYSAINYDFLYKPHTALSEHELCESAFTPPLATVALTLPFPDRSVVIAPILNGSYVTIHDILQSTYQALRNRVYGPEFYALPPETQRRVTKAFRYRCQTVSGHLAGYLETMKGLKVIDLLLLHTKFFRLSSTNGPGIWKVNVI